MNWWHYLLLVNFYLVLFFGFYALLLRRETFFQLNRIYLVAASLLSFLIPVIQADWVKNLFITQEVQYTIYNSPVMVYNLTPTKEALTLGQILSVCYVLVTLFLLLRLIWQLVILKKEIEKPEPSAAYSFFKKISLGNNPSNPEVIAAHEQVHASQWHSLDVLIIETVMIINWFNPVVYLYRFAIKYIHEFIADREVLQSGTDKADYALLLLSQTFNTPAHHLSTPFYNHSLLKQRIMMLQKNKSQRIMLAKYGLSAPLFILMLIFSSATVNNSKAVNVINKKAENVLMTPAEDAVTHIIDHAEIPDSEIDNKNEEAVVADTTHKNDKVFLTTQKLPSFPGGMGSFYMFLGKTIKYPAADRKNSVQGKVIAQFIVEKDGQLSNIKVLHGPSKTLSDEAIRALSASPKWIPGRNNDRTVRVKYTVPITFTLAADDAVPAAPAAPLAGDKIFSAVETQPEFPGGVPGFYQYLMKNIRYPAEMKKNNVQGRVIVQFTVERDGTLSDIKALRSPGYGSAEEAVRVMALSPKWSPGIQNGKPVRVQYTVPINFTLGNTGQRVHAAIMDSTARRNTVFGDTTPDPLFIVDGVEADAATFKALRPESIESVVVVKDQSATAIYGTKGSNGVILISMKKRPDSNTPSKTIDITPKATN